MSRDEPRPNDQHDREPLDRPSEPSSGEPPARSPDLENFFADPDDEERWDADDPRRQHDQMAPPKESCECYCLHCQRVFMSDGIWFQRVIGDPAGFEGFWMCPTPNCDGAGFTFDIFPTDPNHPANAGWCDDEDDAEEDDDEFDDFDEPESPMSSAADDYDPDESKYKELDAEMGDGESDFAEGDEWKLGLAPGEEPSPQMFWSESARKEWEEEQKRYDATDERPRELDWSNREDRKNFKDDDIPF